MLLSLKRQEYFDLNSSRPFTQIKDEIKKKMWLLMCLHAEHNAGDVATQWCFNPLVGMMCLHAARKYTMFIPHSKRLKHCFLCPGLLNANDSRNFFPALSHFQYPSEITLMSYFSGNYHQLNHCNYAASSDAEQSICFAAREEKGKIKSLDDDRFGFLGWRGANSHHSLRTSSAELIEAQAVLSRF